MKVTTPSNASLTETPGPDGEPLPFTVLIALIVGIIVIIIILIAVIVYLCCYSSKYLTELLKQNSIVICITESKTDLKTSETCIEISNSLKFCLIFD